MREGESLIFTAHVSLQYSSAIVFDYSLITGQKFELLYWRLLNSAL